MAFNIVFLFFSFLGLVSGHITAWHPSMWGFNFTTDGNRPQDPLMDMTFQQWWFHDHLAYPPHKDDFLEFPAGGKTTVETTCDKGASSYWTTNPGGQIKDVRANETNYPCPFQPLAEFHTENEADVKGCAFAIAYIPPSEVNTIKPEDFTVFSTNRKCVWTKFTDFQVPARMPACPPGGCTCAWFWVHSADSGSEQIYMNGYQCNITNVQSNAAPLAKPQVARRCGEDTDPESLKPADPKNCTYGAKQPIYWLNKEGNTFFENPHHPPFYNEMYAWTDGAQDDIFVDSDLPEMDWAGAPKKVNGVFPTVTGNFGSAKAAEGGGAQSVAPKVVSSSAASSAAALSTAPASSAKASMPAPVPSSDPVPAPAPSMTDVPASSEPVAPVPAPSSDPAPMPAPSMTDSSNPAPAPSTGNAPPHHKSHHPGCGCKAGGKNHTVTITATVTATMSDASSETKTISPAEASEIVSSSKPQSKAGNASSPEECDDNKHMRNGKMMKRSRRSMALAAHRKRYSQFNIH